MGRAGSLLKKGTGSELMPDYATEKRSRRGACALFQQVPRRTSDPIRGVLDRRTTYRIIAANVAHCLRELTDDEIRIVEEATAR